MAAGAVRAAGPRALRLGSRYLWCLLLLACADSTSDASDPVRRDASTRQQCRFNSDCPPGFYCKDRVCQVDCRADRDCEGAAICESGQCVNPEPDLGPDAARVPDAALPDVAVEVPDARRPDGADPDAVLPDAAIPDAAQPDAAPMMGNVELGGPCQRAFHCASDICFSEPNNAQQGFCSKLCCSENDCPAGFGCLYFNGTRACFPARLFPTNNFTTPAGGPCNAAANDCRTGACLDNRCLGACCTNRDCLGAMCVWLPTDAGSVRAVCDRPNLLGGPAGSFCGSDLDCDNRVCVLNPNPPNGAPPGLCVDWCCTNEDCPVATVCGQVLGPGRNVISACVPRPPGPTADGEPCNTDETCASGICAEGFCRQPCCNDVDRNGACAPGLRCLPRNNLEGTLVRVCAPPDGP